MTYWASYTKTGDRRRFDQKQFRSCSGAQNYSGTAVELVWLFYLLNCTLCWCSPVLSEGSIDLGGSWKLYTTEHFGQQEVSFTGLFILFVLLLITSSTVFYFICHCVRVLCCVSLLAFSTQNWKDMNRKGETATANNLGGLPSKVGKP